MPGASRSHSAIDPRVLIRELVRAGEVTVPPYPAVATRLQQLASDERVGARALADVVGHDAALAAVVIRHASAVATGGQQVVTLEQAVFKLGAAELARIALTVSLGALAARSGPLVHLRHHRWREALLSALFARELAARRGLHPDQAFLAGLIHDLGATLALGLIEQQLALGALEPRSDEAWNDIIDGVHVDLGLLLAQRWQLPEPLREIIAHHHHPDACLRIYRPQVKLIQIIDQIIVALAGPDGTAALRDVHGLDDDERARIAAVVPRVADAIAAFEPPMPASDGARQPAAASRLAPPGGWPVDFAVDANQRRASFRAVALTPSALSITGATPLLPNWLVALRLETAGGPIELLANVLTCDPDGAGGHLATVQPYGLDGPVKKAWLSLIETTRRRSQPPTGAMHEPAHQASRLDRS